MDRQKAGKIKIAAAIGLGFALGLSIGYGLGYAAGINRAIEIGLRFFDFELKPGAEALIKSYLIGHT